MPTSSIINPTLFLHDSRTGAKRAFAPLDPQRVTIYVCGPTVYNFVHIGNGRPAVVFDVLVRLLRYLYPHVMYARNITDVDDKINVRALEAGEPIDVFTERYVTAYNEDVKALGVLAPDVEPRATHHIDEIIALIKQLIGEGFAYAAEGHVLFNVPANNRYGALSHRHIDDMIAGARVEVAPYKRHPADFVLWKPSSPELPGWESPWGRGRPGWHIECSAMIEKHLGASIDIHGGGSDLIFPHHENELAQSACIHDDIDWVRYWLHNGMLTMGGEKMAKSVGNFVTIRDLLTRVDGEVLRYALLSGQYRSPLEWSERLLAQAQSSLDRLYGALRDAYGARAANNATNPIVNAQAQPNAIDDDIPQPVLDALLDDLNTPGALAALHDLAGQIHRATSSLDAQALAEQLRKGASVLGLLQRSPQAYFQAPGGAGGLDDAMIDALIAARRLARTNKDFVGADAIRKQLSDAGIELEDSAQGTRWKRTR